MTKLKIVQGKSEISNEAGKQLVGSHAPNQEGLSPKELLEAAVALCVSISLQKILERDEIVVNLDTITIDVQASKEEGITNRFTHFDIFIKLPNTLTEDYKKKLLLIVERSCTIGNTITQGAQINTIEI